MKPSIPQNLCTTRVDETTVAIHWDPSAAGAPILAYVIEVRGPGEKDFHEVARVDGGTLEYEVTDLMEDTEYEFAVRAENKGGLSEGSARMEEPVTTKPKIGGLHRPDWQTMYILPPIQLSLFRLL